MSFENKVVIVTGAGSGIGAATAVAYAKEGASVVLVGRTRAKLDNVARQCEAYGQLPLVVPADVTKLEDATRIIDSTITKFGKLDILINNAGIAVHGSSVSEDAISIFDDIMNTNLRAVVQLTSLAVPLLTKTKGNVVNVSSVAGKKVFEQMTAYMASKAALDHYSRGAARELAAAGVRLNVVSPGPVLTEIMAGVDENMRQDILKILPIKRFSEPEEIADIILFLSSDKAIGITGSDYVSDNGMLLT